MVDKEILEAIAELGESELKRLKLLIDNKLNLDTNKTKISYRSKDIKCGRESCNSCPMDRIGMQNGLKMVKEKLNI